MPITVTVNNDTNYPAKGLNDQTIPPGESIQFDATKDNRRGVEKPKGFKFRAKAKREKGDNPQGQDSKPDPISGSLSAEVTNNTDQTIEAKPSYKGADWVTIEPRQSATFLGEDKGDDEYELDVKLRASKDDEDGDEEEEAERGE